MRGIVTSRAARRSRVVTSELTRIELGSAVRRARDAGRLPTWHDVRARFDSDCGGDSPLALLRLRADAIFAHAHELVVAHPLRTLAAIHLAAALHEEVAVFVTRDSRQADAAAALGLTVR
ncbi:MAG: PIN domain-containing protein [Gaiellaceae bacterium]